jgi:nucleoside-diphosphate-sugar epimerase
MGAGDFGVNHLFCFGLGYSARALVSQLRGQDWQIYGTARSPEKLSQIARMGVESHVFDGQTASATARDAIAKTTHVLVSAPPGPNGDPVLACHAKDLGSAPSLEWIGYLSTVGVYGDWQGEWVDEDTPPRPLSERSRCRLEAETAWLEFGARTGKRVRIFRLSGIYGPGRGPFEKVRTGTAQRIIKPGQVFNRIHVDDIARVLIASMSGLGQHSIYNVTDDEPAPPQDVVTFAADLLGISPPPEIDFDTANLKAMAASFYSENKRVRNARIKDDLGVALAFPTYREGLQNLLN